jgi:hypothetical protein
MSGPTESSVEYELLRDATLAEIGVPEAQAR